METHLVKLNSNKEFSKFQSLWVFFSAKPANVKPSAHLDMPSCCSLPRTTISCLCSLLPSTVLLWITSSPHLHWSSEWVSEHEKDSMCTCVLCVWCVLCVVCVCLLWISMWQKLVILSLKDKLVYYWYPAERNVILSTLRHSFENIFPFAKNASSSWAHIPKLIASN